MVHTLKMLIHNKYLLVSSLYVCECSVIHIIFNPNNISVTTHTMTRSTHIDVVYMQFQSHVQSDAVAASHIPIHCFYVHDVGPTMGQARLCLLYSE